LVLSGRWIRGIGGCVRGRWAYTLAALPAVLAAALIVPARAGAATAELNYRYYCAACHGLKGKGDGPNATKSQPVRPRNHTDATQMSLMSDSEIIDVIKNGGAATSRSRMMPPFGGTLSQDEVVALKDYLRKLCGCRARNSLR